MTEVDRTVPDSERAGGEDRHGLRPTDLRNLSPGDSVEVHYGSAYSDTRQIVGAEVVEVSAQKSVDGSVLWVEVYLDLGDEEGDISERRRETYRSEGQTRRLSAFTDGSSGFTHLEARNGARWHNISEDDSVVVRGDCHAK